MFVFVVQLLNRVWLFATPWTACSMPGLPVLCSNSFPLSQWCHATISSSCCPLLLLPSIFPKNQSLFQWVGSSHQVAKWSELQFQHQPFNEFSGLISFRIDWFEPLQSKGLSRVFSNTIVRKDKFFGSQPSLWFKSHISTWLLEKITASTMKTFVGKAMSLFF